MTGPIRPVDGGVRLERAEDYAEILPLEDILPHCTHPMHAGTRHRATSHVRRSARRRALPSTLASVVYR